MLVKNIFEFFDPCRADFNRQKACIKGNNIRFYNWGGKNIEDWFEQFLKNTGLLHDGQIVNLCSVFGKRRVLNYINDGITIFFSGENSHHRNYTQYADYLLGKPNCRLALGFDYFEDERYLRFPLWLLYMFEPRLDSIHIKRRCAALTNPNTKERRELFSCLIARYDDSGLRTEIFHKLTPLGRIDCPSDFLHNDNSLRNDYDDDKRAYLKNYKFNICPENTNSYGYVTEKAFEAIEAGCIPIYWGSYNQPEKGILNPEAIILWDCESNGERAFSQVEQLTNDPILYSDFANQPRLMPGAHEKIEEMFVNLYEKLKLILD